MCAVCQITCKGNMEEVCGSARSLLYVLHKYCVSVFTYMINTSNSLCFTGCIGKHAVCVFVCHILLGRGGHSPPCVHCGLHASSMCAFWCTGMYLCV